MVFQIFQILIRIHCKYMILYAFSILFISCIGHSCAPKGMYHKAVMVVMPWPLPVGLGSVHQFPLEFASKQLDHFPDHFPIPRSGNIIGDHRFWCTPIPFNIHRLIPNFNGALPPASFRRSGCGVRRVPPSALPRGGSFCKLGDLSIMGGIEPTRFRE